MTLESGDRVRLRSRARALKARISVGKAGLTEGVIAQIRQAFESTDLLKVRIHEPDRKKRDELAERIAGEAPCELVDRVGFVATLYKPD